LSNCGPPRSNGNRSLTLLANAAETKTTVNFPSRTRPVDALPGSEGCRPWRVGKGGVV
jgi:hypothetical protein